MRYEKKPLWDNTFPEVPECFHRTVIQEIDRQVRDKSCRRKKHIGRKASAGVSGHLNFGYHRVRGGKTSLFERFDMDG